MERPTRTCYFPDYWDDFSCKGGDCRTTCCGGWNIEISWAEYYRLAEQNCSPELRRRIDQAIMMSDEPTEDKFIMPDARGKCPMFDDDGLCMLQKECGVDAITAICRQYPRGCKRGSEGVVLSLATSCEAVTERLLERREPIRILSSDRAPLELTTDSTYILPPEYIGKCFDIMEDRSMPLSGRLAMLGAYLSDPTADPTYPASDAGDNGREVMPGHLLRLARNCIRSTRSLQGRPEQMFARYMAEDGAAAFLQDLAALRAECPDLEIKLENILINHMIHGYFTGATSYLGGGSLYSGLVCVYGAVLVFCALQWHDEPGDRQLADILAALFRYIDHSAFYLMGPDMLGVRDRDMESVLDAIIRL